VFEWVFLFFKLNSTFLDIISLQNHVKDINS
jgi:hypothetical protein